MGKLRSVGSMRSPNGAVPPELRGGGPVWTPLPQPFAERLGALMAQHNEFEAKQAAVKREMLAAVQGFQIGLGFDPGKTRLNVDLDRGAFSIQALDEGTDANTN